MGYFLIFIHTFFNAFSFTQTLLSICFSLYSFRILKYFAQFFGLVNQCFAFWVHFAWNPIEMHLLIYFPSFHLLEIENILQLCLKCVLFFIKIFIGNKLRFAAGTNCCENTRQRMDDIIFINSRCEYHRFWHLRVRSNERRTDKHQSSRVPAW